MIRESETQSANRDARWTEAPLCSSGPRSYSKANSLEWGMNSWRTKDTIRTVTASLLDLRFFCYPWPCWMLVRCLYDGWFFGLSSIKM